MILNVWINSPATRFDDSNTNRIHHHLNLARVYNQVSKGMKLVKYLMNTACQVKEKSETIMNPEINPTVQNHVRWSDRHLPVM